MAKPDNTVVVAIPEELTKLTSDETARLKKAFKTTLANELNPKAGKASIVIKIDNTNPKPPRLTIKGSAKSAKQGSAKSAKPGRGSGKGSKSSKK